jgi:hypothetical protein
MKASDLARVIASIRDPRRRAENAAALAAGLRPAQPKQNRGPALVERQTPTGRRSDSLEYCVTFVCCCARLSSDDDNRAGSAGYKQLRDRVAEWLGLDDHQRGIHWECRTICSPIEGTIVRITKL